MTAYFWVAIGGALGSVSRFWMSGWIAERYGETFPWNTLFINVTGSFVIGVFGALTLPEGRWTASPALRQLFMVGVCGGYTTFSSFSLQTLYLIREREWLYAGGNAVLSVALCMIAVWLGFVAGSALNSLKGS
ncbi:MAG: fluoride efflux transporter CrcB [Verrucomicrobiota bacterium]